MEKRITRNVLSHEEFYRLCQWLKGKARSINNQPPELPGTLAEITKAARDALGFDVVPANVESAAKVVQLPFEVIAGRPKQSRLVDLEQRLAALESQLGVRWDGTGYAKP